MKNQLVTIANFPFHTDPRLALLTARLEHESILCSAADATTISADPLLSQAIGGVKVKVRAEDVPRALEIFHDIEHSLAAQEELVPDEEDREWEEEREQEAIRAQKNFYIALGIILAAVFLFLMLS